jgi:G3E family GTPase
VKGEGDLDKEMLERLIGTYLWETDLVLRCKGVFKSSKGDQMMLQGVGTLFEFRSLAATSPQNHFDPSDTTTTITKNSQKPESHYTFLFVGRGLESQKLKSEIEACRS